jgi:hypothetical protein
MAEVAETLAGRRKRLPHRVCSVLMNFSSNLWHPAPTGNQHVLSPIQSALVANCCDAARILN